MKAIEKIFKLYDLEPLDNQYLNNVFENNDTVLAGWVKLEDNCGYRKEKEELLNAIREEKIDVYYDFQTLYFGGELFIVLNDKLMEYEFNKNYPRTIILSLLSRTGTSAGDNHTITTIRVGDTDEYVLSIRDFINLLNQPERVKEYKDNLTLISLDIYGVADPDEEWDEESDSEEHA